MEIRLLLSYKNRSLKEVDKKLIAIMEHYGFQCIGASYRINRKLRNIRFEADLDTILKINTGEPKK